MSMANVSYSILIINWLFKQSQQLYYCCVMLLCWCL